MFFICKGKSCRQNQERLVTICEALDSIAQTKSVRCQKICNGQVIGVRLGDKLRWIKKVRPKPHVKLIKRWIETGRCPKKLKPLRVKKRNNKLR